MQEIFDRIIAKMEDASFRDDYDLIIGLDDAINIVNEVAEEFGNSEQVDDGWIPFKLREVDAEEKEVFGCKTMLDCKLPEEEEEILVTYKYGDKLFVDTDIFCRDGNECYLESGIEFGIKAIAWRPYPAPYRPKGDNNGKLLEMQSTMYRC